MTDLRQETAQHGEHTAPVEAWDAIAARYDEHVAPGESELATAGLRLAGLQAGDTFLDVAAGPGGLSLPAARLGAKVLATDWSPKMIEHFNARAAAEGLDAEGRVMDCHALELADDTYDITGSQFGVMLVPDQPQALREMVRVTRPADAFCSSPTATRRVRGAALLHQRGPGGGPRVRGPRGGRADARVPSRRPGRPASAADRRRPDRDVTVDTSHQERITVRTGQQLWDWCLGGNPIPGMLVADLTDAQRADIVQVLDGMVRERSGDNGPAVLTAPLNIGVGTK